MSSALSFRGVGPLRGAGTGCAGVQSGQGSGAGAARFHAAGFIRLHVLCVWLEVSLRYAVWETVRARFQRLPGYGLPLHAAAPARPRSARTLRASFCACGARAMGYVRGFAPNTPPGNFTVLNRRASPYRAHRLFRTAPSGRCFGHWPRSPLALWTFHLFPPCLRYLFLLHPSIPYRSAAIASSNPSAGISSHSSPFARFIHCHARISFHVFSHSSCT